MIVHLFPQEKFTVPLIKLINYNCNSDEHLFIVHNKNTSYKKHQVDKYNNIVCVNKESIKNIIKFIKYMNEADKIIIHSLIITKLVKYYIYYETYFIKKDWMGNLGGRFIFLQGGV